MQIQKSCVVQLGGIAYWVRDRVEHRLPHLKPHEYIIPAVSVSLQEATITVEFLQSKFEEFARSDDVFTQEFTHSSLIIVQTNTRQELSLPIGPEVQSYLDAISAQLVFEGTETDIPVPEGPYFLTNNCLHQAWRLYEDTLEAFVSSTVPDAATDYGFCPLQAAAYDGLHSVVGVPSRLYFTNKADKPLNGMRLSVKDLFHLQGMKTTIGSRAYTECYGPQSTTSAFVKRLIDNGAIIVGKTKMSAFAGSEVPPDKCIDYFPPWNPRADGYQGPSGSSSGAGASIAGYNWLDGSIASDTTGSLRMPASAYGLWGIRPIHNAFSFEGAVRCVEMWDTAGVLARDPRIIENVLKASGEAEDLHTPLKFPKKILYPTDWFPQSDKGQQQMTDEFLEILEKTLGTQHVKVSLAEEWKKSPPPEAAGKSIEDFLMMSWYWPMFFDPFHNAENFRADYRAKFDKEPYVSPAQRERWTKGREVTSKERNQAIDELRILRHWLDAHIFTKSPDGVPECIMLLPLGRAGPNYRDVAVKPSASPPTVADLTAYDPVLFASMVGFPQIVIPIGQNPFHSINSLKDTFVPIVSSLIGSPGTDLSLIHLAKTALEQARWPTCVLTGELAFHVGENNRKAKLVDRDSMNKESHQIKL